jgi:hypothetical protein
VGVPLFACEVLVISALQPPAGKMHGTDTWKPQLSAVTLLCPSLLINGRHMTGKLQKVMMRVEHTTLSYQTAGR